MSTINHPDPDVQKVAAALADAAHAGGLSDGYHRSADEALARVAAKFDLTTGRRAQRDAGDDAGRLIDSADRILKVTQGELLRLRELSSETETMGGLLYALVCAWANEAIEAGRLTEEEPEYDTIRDALVSLSIRVEPDVR